MFSVDRYEREEPFLALNLTVTKCHDLQDSLDQFVKGELLEGDNAYYCEKCNQKVCLLTFSRISFIFFLCFVNSSHDNNSNIIDSNNLLVFCFPLRFIDIMFGYNDLHYK